MFASNSRRKRSRRCGLRWGMGVVMGLGFAASSIAGAGVPAPAGTWPLYRHDPGNTGSIGISLRPPLSRVWRRRLDPRYAQVWIEQSSHVLASSTGVYVAAMFKTGDNQHLPWMILSAFEPQTGTRLWQMEGVLTTGCLIGETLVTVRAKPQTSRGEHYVVGLDARSGKVRWEHPTGQSGPVAGQPYPTSDGKRAFLFWGKALVIDAATGKIVLGKPEATGGSFAPAIAGDRIALPKITEVEARQVRAQVDFLRTSDLATLFSIHDTGYLNPMLLARHLVVGHGEPGGSILVYRRSQDSYEQVWSARSSARKAYVADPRRGILILSHDWDAKTRRASVLRAYALKDGREVWSYRPLTVTALGAATKDVIYLPGSRNVRGQGVRGGLYALGIGTGKLLWQYEREELRFSAPAIGQSRVFTFGTDGYLYGFGAR